MRTTDIIINKYFFDGGLALHVLRKQNKTEDFGGGKWKII